MNPISGYSPSPQMNAQRSGHILVNGKSIAESTESSKLFHEGVALLKETLGESKALNVLNHAVDKETMALNFYTHPGSTEPYVSFNQVSGNIFSDVSTQKRIASMPVSMTTPYVDSRSNLNDLYKPSLKA